ncbi:MAG: ATP-binding protein [Planctomycetaceae bacterium]
MDHLPRKNREPERHRAPDYEVATIGKSVGDWANAVIPSRGIESLPKRSGEFLFEIIMRWHELRSTLMTSNRPLEDWGKLMSDTPAGTANLDRCLQSVAIIEFIVRRASDGKARRRVWSQLFSVWPPGHGYSGVFRWISTFECS